jgi:putative IMPACT (imprinted ancient) family translation regulator
MLTALLHSGVGEIVAVCTRYFGGTKLGTGGLSRAYSGGVNLALETLPTQERVERVTLRLAVEYESVDPLRRLLEEVEALVEGEEYGEAVRYRVAVPRESVEALTERLAGITRGRAVVEIVGGDPEE